MKTIAISGIFLLFIGVLGGFAVHSLSAGSDSDFNTETLKPTFLDVSIYCPSALWQGCAVILESREAVEMSCDVNWSVSSAVKKFALSQGYQEPKLVLEWTTNKGSVQPMGTPEIRWDSSSDRGIATVCVNASVVYKRKTGGLFSRNKRDEISFSVSAQQHILIPSTYEETYEDADKSFEIGRYAVPVSVTAEKYPMMYPEKYQCPKAFYKVTKETAGVKVSPRFTIGDFDLYYDYLDYQYPQYVALDKLIIIKLEKLLDLMNLDGVEVPTFALISGFRPPSYNRGSIKQGADLKMPFSRHQYGDAVDLLVDINPEDGIMDDLNRDGRIDIHDAAVIQKYVNRMDRVFIEENSPLLGGAGIYARHDIFERPVQSPYIHIDTRGYVNSSGRPVRWIEDDPKPEEVSRQ